jgi:hypothetical protein
LPPESLGDNPTTIIVIEKFVTILGIRASEALDRHARIIEIRLALDDVNNILNGAKRQQINFNARHAVGSDKPLFLLSHINFVGLLNPLTVAIKDTRNYLLEGFHGD